MVVATRRDRERAEFLGDVDVTLALGGVLVPIEALDTVDI